MPQRRNHSTKWRNNTAILKHLVKFISPVPPRMMHLERQNIGFFFGTTNVLGFKYHVSKPSKYDNHILVIGGSGSGKSSCVSMPNLSTWSDTIIATDIKGELSAHYSHLHNAGKTTRPFIRFAPMEESGWGYDPFALLRQVGERYLTQYAREIALSIIPLPPDVREPFWIESAQNLLTGAILYYYGIGANFSQTIIGIQTTPIKELVAEIVDSQDQNALMFVNQLQDIKIEVLAGVATELSNRIMVFATDPFINSAFRDSREDKKCFVWDDMSSHHIFLCIPEDKIEQWRGAIKLMLNQLFRTLERRSDKHSLQGASILPVLLLLDEMPRLGKLEIVNAVSTLRSKNVTIAIFIQSLAQLDLTYGEHARRVIADNCAYKVFLGANDPESQRYMSDIIGDHEVTKKTYSKSYQPQKPQVHNNETGQSVSASKQYEPKMRSTEFGKLKDAILVTPEGHYRVKKEPYYSEDKTAKKNPIVRAVRYIARKVVGFVKRFIDILR